MNITEQHPLKCKYSGSYPLWNNETKGFDIYQCNECLKMNKQNVAEKNKGLLQ